MLAGKQAEQRHITGVESGAPQRIDCFETFCIGKDFIGSESSACLLLTSSTFWIWFGASPRAIAWCSTVMSHPKASSSALSTCSAGTGSASRGPRRSSRRRLSQSTYTRGCRRPLTPRIRASWLYLIVVAQIVRYATTSWSSDWIIAQRLSVHTLRHTFAYRVLAWHWKVESGSGSTDRGRRRLARAGTNTWRI